MRSARPTLTVADLAALTATPPRTVRWQVAQWRARGWPRVYQAQRTSLDGRRLGGVQWVIDATDYEDLCNGRLRPDLPRAA